MIWAYQYTILVAVGAWRHIEAWYHAVWWGLGILCQQKLVGPVCVSELFPGARFLLHPWAKTLVTVNLASTTLYAMVSEIQFAIIYLQRPVKSHGLPWAKQHRSIFWITRGSEIMCQEIYIWWDKKKNQHDLANCIWWDKQTHVKKPCPRKWDKDDLITQNVAVFSKLIPGESPALHASFCIWKHFLYDFVDSATVSSIPSHSQPASSSPAKRR